MLRAVVCGLALLAAGALSPARAGNVYIPIVERTGAGGATYDTEVWVSNNGQVARSFVTTFLAAETDGTKRSGVVSSARIRVGANGTFRLGNSAPAGQHGLLEVDATPQLLIGARVAAATQAGAAGFAALPVISSDNLAAANSAVDLLGLERQTDRVTDISVVNLAKTASSCQLTLLRSNGGQITAATVAVPPLSLRRFGDALADQNSITDARARVQCNRDFYAFATQTDLATSRISFNGPAASGASTLTPPGATPVTQPGTIVYSAPGVLLVPSRTQEVRIIGIPVDKPLALTKMVIELDFTIGPWYPGNTSGPHAIIWLHRGKYGTDTFANVNVHGPTKNKLRMNQNIDLPGRDYTIGDQPGKYEVGKTYHFRYTYDAVAQNVRAVVTQGSEVINDFSIGGTAKDHILNVPARGLTAVLGHASGQDFEVPSWGWTYSNLRVEMTPR